MGFLFERKMSSEIEMDNNTDSIFSTVMWELTICLQQYKWLSVLYNDRAERWLVFSRWMCLQCDIDFMHVSL